MQRIMLTSLLALGLLAFLQQPASAWTRTNANAGANLSSQGGGNSAFFGLWKSSEMPNQMIDGPYQPPYGGGVPIQDGLVPPPQDKPEKLGPPTTPATRPASYWSYPQANYPYYYYPNYYYGR
jgi:hypothetical protein